VSLSLLVEEWADEAEVYYVNVVVVEDVFFHCPEFLGIDVNVEKQVIELQVVEDEAGGVDLLKDIEKLNTKRVNGCTRELSLSSLEEIVKCHTILWHNHV
jgi:hypothetical protein